MPTDALRTQDALRAYFARTGFNREPRPDLATLAELIRLHLIAFPYENLDIQIGRRVTRDPADAFSKLVGRPGGRGGWCFEYNGLFAFMLEAVGFRVRRLAGAVMRETAGDIMVGNHLVPLVELDRLYMADVAMGHFRPVPLVEGPIRHDWRRYSLERTADGWWRFRNHPGQLPPSFDFSLDVDDPALMDRQSDWLQSDPGSPFVRNAIIQRHLPARMDSLVGRTLTTIDATGERSIELPDEAAYLRVARATFGLSFPELRAVWAKIDGAPRAGFLDGLDEAA